MPVVDSTSLRVIWEALLPDHIVIEVGDYSTSAQPGGASEQEAAAAMQDARRLEFLSGRFYARKALLVLGRRPVDIPVAADRGPVWPDGIVGSITHTLGTTSGWAAAAVSDVATVRSLGIDMESCENLDSRALEVVLTPTERAYLTKIPLALRSRQAGLIWCAKEAALKAARGMTEPTEVEIVLSESSQEFRATRRPRLPEEPGKEWAFEGHALCCDGFAFAAAYR